MPSEVRRTRCPKCYQSWLAAIHAGVTEGDLDLSRQRRRRRDVTPVGVRLCPVCSTAFIARTEASRHCSLWCAYPDWSR